MDVAIVGAGYTGLWTAYYLKSLEPGLRVAIVEAEVAGFGASGRNGGWCVGTLAGMADSRRAISESIASTAARYLTLFADPASTAIVVSAAGGTWKGECGALKATQTSQGASPNSPIFASASSTLSVVA